MNKFEQLIEYVINDEDTKARELFHEIVVEKSRQIYEEIMDEEDELEDGASTEHKDKRAEKAGDTDKMQEGMHELGGDAADDLIDDIEADETGISMEDEDDDEELDMVDSDMDTDMDTDMEMDMDSKEDLEDRVVDLEDQLDELMAEFEELMSGNGAESDDMDMDMDMDSEMGMDSEEVVDDELETEGMMENVDLKAAPKPTTSEEGSINKKSVVAANSGAKGAMAKPVAAPSGEEKGRSAPKAQDMGGTTQPDVKAAPRAVTTQASGVNTKSPIN